jgi:hypothetical protein
MNNKIEPKDCTGSGLEGHGAWYGKIGFSPCGEYVSHESDKPCDVIEGKIVNDNPINPDNCECRTDSCECGDFISHKISDPCTAKA